MDDLRSIEMQIRERLAAAESLRQQKQVDLIHAMSAHDKRCNRFKAVAKHLLNKLVLPRVQMLETLFPNAHVTTGGSSTTRHCRCNFDHTPDFPATTSLAFSLTPNDDFTSVVVGYTLEILPVFFRYEPTDQFAVSLENLHEQPLASWLDEKLLKFTETYLKVQEVEQYQDENATVDPVCGMTINRNHAAASVDYNGKKYFFCVAECREKFLRDPDRYLRKRVRGTVA